MSTAPVLAGAEPFHAAGGPVGVLLCHGFTGSPQSMRPWAEHLHEQGYTVSLPRLPGHGTSWQDMNTTTWEQWLATVEDSLLELSQQTETVMVAGLSMGGALALALAQKHPDLVSGLALVNPAVTTTDTKTLAVPVLKHLVGSVPGVGNDVKNPDVQELAYDRVPLKALHTLLRGWRQVRNDLPSVHCPVMIFRSPEDHVVAGINTQLIMRGVSSTEVGEVLCENSYHVATIDYDAEMIFEQSSKFFAQVAAASSR